MSPVVDAPILESAPEDLKILRTRPKASRQVGRLLAIMWLTTVVALALLIPILSVPSPAVSTGVFDARPFGHYLLGTDELARDEFSRLVWGARTSLEVCFVTITIAMLVGTTLGLLAGYFRGKTDTAIAGLTDLVLAIPGLVFLLVLTVVFRPSTNTLMIGIAVLLTPTFVRLSRANTIAWAEREFVRAAHVLGARNRRVILREVLPNVMPSVLTYAVIAGGYVLVIEGSLSFLGLGIPPPTPSWGSMIADGETYMQNAPQLVLVPAVCLFLTVMSTNVLGNSRRQANERVRGGTL
ncbi:MAG TPA: ABC transporter permease [Acidimicrobiales bacterium]|jgi:peptide/nickel transport system permease protein|nr:ABC transporter permease [Acidimicrobiales bacterium]